MTSIYGNNTPIGAEMLLRNNDVASAKDETACKGKGWEWSLESCLSPCPEGYSSAKDVTHGDVCNKNPPPGGRETTTVYMASPNTLQTVADTQQKNTDVFVKDPPHIENPTSTILLDLGGGVRIDTQGVIAIIALVYVLITRKS
jgi:hypothetical protein